MFRKILLGLVATCVCAMLTTTAGLGAAADIVLYAGDAANLRGNWTRGTDASAAGGQVLISANNGWSNSSGALAAPADSVDFVFSAPAATSFHVWLRMRAAGNSKYNDSVFAQFSDATDANGKALYAIGTTSGLTVNLAAGSTGAGLAGWGWQDGAYWLTQTTTLRFASTGTHTLRIQTREDGVQIDQVVLSPTTYLTKAPGPVSNDTTIVPKATASTTTLPSPWLNQDIGATGLVGGAAASGGTLTATGSGADIWGTADAFQFVSQPVAGDSQIVARLASLQNTNAYAKAGVMLRETTTAGSAHVLLDVRPGGDVEFMSRVSSGAATTFLAGGMQPAPTWLKLTRSGSMVSGWVSATGSSWTLVGSTSIAISNSALMGLAVTSHDSTQLNTAAFDSVSVTVPVAAPGVPTALAPATGTTGSALTTTFTWNAASATSYDVAFGTTNPPATVAAGLSAAAFTPAPLQNNTTYYWQVTARNAGGATAGPVASFTTIVAAPGVPTLASPTAGATGTSLRPTLTWSATGATSYTVSFGTTNPPAAAGSAATSTAYTPAALDPATTYYWQVVASNAAGATAGPIWSFTTGGLPTPWQSQDVGLVGLLGQSAFSNGTFTVAGAGADIWGAADAFQFVSQPVSGDVQITARVVNLQSTNVYAKSGVILRGSTASDAAHVILDIRPNGEVEFMTRTATGGSTTYLTGATVTVPAFLKLTRSGSTVTGAVSPDGTAWTPVGSTVTALPANALVGLIVTSHDVTVLNTVVFDDIAVTVPPAPSVTPTSTPSPTPTPTPAPVPASAPVAYNAISDRNAYLKPALPALGAAGSSFNDPTFGSKIVRVTDGSTRPGLVDRSFRVPSNAHLTAWNATSTAFYVVSNDGTAIPYTFNPATATPSRIQASASGNGGLTLAFYVEPQFSLVNPNVIYGAVTGANNRTISQYDFSTGAYTPVVDLDAITGGLAGTYIGGLMTGGTTVEKLMTFFGAASQDSHFYAMWTPVGNLAARKLLNTANSTINGSATNITLNFRLHSAMIDKSGRFVFLYPTGGDIAAPRSAAQVYVWDTDTDTLTAITGSMLNSGHDAAGFGYWVNQDCCTSSAWDAAQWQFRSLTDPSRHSDLISPILATKEVYLADHTTWANARPDALVPVISSTYRFGTNTAAWRAWDDEIIGVDTANGGGGVVYRFAHHRSIVGSDADPTRPYFWYEPIANVSPDGRWVLFTSNWEKTLGRDASEGTFRQDVFVVQLTPQ